MLVGNVVALLSPLIFIPILTYVPPFKPQKYDWVSMALISKGDDSTVDVEDPERANGDVTPVTALEAAQADGEKKSDLADIAAQDSDGSTPRRGSILTATQVEGRKKLDHSAKWARFMCVALALCFIILWPMPLFGSGYIFSREFFTGWTVVGIIWLFCSSGVVVFLPLWQSRSTIAKTARGIVADLSGGRGRRGKAETSNS